MNDRADVQRVVDRTVKLQSNKEYTLEGGKLTKTESYYCTEIISKQAEASRKLPLFYSFWKVECLEMMSSWWLQVK